MNGNLTLCRGLEAVELRLEVVEDLRPTILHPASLLLGPGHINHRHRVDAQRRSQLLAQRRWITPEVAVQDTDRCGFSGYQVTGTRVGVPHPNGYQAYGDAVEHADRLHRSTYRIIDA